jgi:hypothetical protein
MAVMVVGCLMLIMVAQLRDLENMHHNCCRTTKPVSTRRLILCCM